MTSFQILEAHFMITVLAFGGGQDSTAILYRLVLDAQFRKKYVRGRLIIIMSDTGDEHFETYTHIEFIRSFCRINKVEFHFIQSNQGFHPRNWLSLSYWMRKYKSIMSISYVKSCTDNLKIKPFYAFLDNLIGKQYYNQDDPPSISRKRWIKRYAEEHGRIRVLLGIAKGEEQRISHSLSHIWMRNSLERYYPLIEEKMNRLDCQQYIASVQLPLPPPSNCKYCPFLSEIELVWLYRFDPLAYYQWVEMEQAKIKKWRTKGLSDDKNLGVLGRKLLPERLRVALMKYGHLTNHELHIHKMNHGHCVQSKY